MGFSNDLSLLFLECLHRFLVLASEFDEESSSSKDSELSDSDGSDELSDRLSSSGASSSEPVMEQPLVLSHLILSTMLLPSYQMNYLSFSIPSLFGLVDNIIKFKGGHMSNMCLLHQSDTSPIWLPFHTLSLTLIG